MHIDKVTRATLFACSLATLGVACGDDDASDTASFRLRIENIAPAYEFSQGGGFALPSGSSEPGPIGPGGAYAIAFDAAPGDRLSFALMLVPSNDFFYGPDDQGVELFDGDGNPRTGNITDQIDIWDAGTEADEDLGTGPNQVQRQAGPNTGPPDPDPSVRLASADNLPGVAAALRVSLESTSDTGFILRLDNVSTGTTLETADGTTQAVPMSPGVFVIHTAPAPLFTIGEPDRGEGLEAIAEDGAIGSLAASLENRSGVTVVLAPGVAVVHDGDGPIFELGAPDRGQGLEAVAEDGDPSTLADALSSSAAISEVTVFNTPTGADGPGPLLSGSAYEVRFTASPGQRLSFATMFVHSNDFFLGPDDLGIDLFDSTGGALTGDITMQTLLWDAGTEVDQVPGFGADQAPRQSGANIGADDTVDEVRLAEDASGRIPAEDQYVRVTLELE